MLERRGNAEIERILRHDAVLQERQQGGVGGVRELRNDRALAFRIVEQEIDGAARGGDETDPRSLGQPSALEGERGLHHVVERATIADAVALAHGEIGRIVAADDAGVGGGRGLRLGGGAGLDRQDRLAGFERAGGRMHEGLRPPDAFDEQRDDAGVRIIDQEVEIIGEIEIGLVAGGDPVGEAQAAVGAGPQPELQRAARLEHAGDRAGRHAAQFGVRIGEQPLPVAVRPHAIGAGQAQICVGQERLEPGAALLRFRILAVADRARIDGGRFHAGGRARR